ncbi:D-alanine--D-alanine ligase [Dehalobacterium formicoaceticum]|uniref:D-alanine--D-alanine ligase n=1 Tax=Dehalobacterium formicoaceticum TaxID=51515 RepID=A0ABT1Y1E9_9FIRM|nr:D-alanine--D-alanine ligase [Dehalobacterium formicoaceticum]MCR6544686.1 D-alanine--D-alanine ligase [Dehalobacterium formicoaceticum]
MTKKIHAGILFGGKSAEHEVSVRSARNIYQAVDKNKYQVTMIGISKSGRWTLDRKIEAGVPFDFVAEPEQPEEILALVTGGGENQLINLKGEKPVPQLDIVFPILHGPFGEDGTVQGALKLAGIPFVGPDVLGSAVGMDKDVMKRLLRDANLPNANFLVLYKYPGEEENPGYHEIVAKLGLPVFVKPANLGSSVGISKVENEGEFEAAIEEAFLYDHKLIVESAIIGREIECAVLGNECPRASIPGEVINTKDFYSYDAKYVNDQDSIIKIPAELSPEAVAKVQKAAIQTYQALCCQGLARVDVFLTPEEEVIINEINTLPGFTSISMYPKLWEISGISYTDLIDRLLTLGMEKFQQDAALKTSK